MNINGPFIDGLPIKKTSKKSHEKTMVKSHQDHVRHVHGFLGPISLGPSHDDGHVASGGSRSGKR